MSDLWLLLALCTGVTYFWRGLGVLLSGRINVDSELFRWAECVAYAMITGIIARMVVMPTGALATCPLWVRVTASAVALLVYRLTGKNLSVGVAAGVITLAAFG
jgi:branched-subunit amino acid transport protein